MELRSDIGQIITVFKEAGLSGFVTTSRKAAMAKHREWDKPSVPCNYQGEPRQVHPEVCKWHRQEKDPWCLQHCGEETTIHDGATNLDPGEYIGDGKGGWKLVKRYGARELIPRTRRRHAAYQKHGQAPDSRQSQENKLGSESITYGR